MAGLGLGVVLASVAACSGSSVADASAQASKDAVCASPVLASATAGRSLVASGLTSRLSDLRRIGNVSPTQWTNLKGSTKITMCTFDRVDARASASIIECPPGQESQDDSLTSTTYLVAPDGTFVVAPGSGPKSGSQTCVSAGPS